MIYDYSKLKGRIVEKCGTQAVFARELGLSAHSVSLKLNNKGSWKQHEMQRAAEILELSERDIQPYFFSIDVQ